MSSILEITENEYLIKLNRSRFNLSFVRSLLKMVEFSSPAGDDEKEVERVAANRKVKAHASSSLDDDDDVEIPDRHIAPSQNHNSEPDYFDSLDEK
ncbi:MAG: hypothetical protein V4592_12100 [Bacteroidota bacterium]